MNRMFESIEEKFGSMYGVNVLSRDPWVVTFDDFLTDSEAKALISTVNNWERSTDTGSSNEFGETGILLYCSVLYSIHLYCIPLFSVLFYLILFISFLFYFSLLSYQTLSDEFIYFGLLSLKPQCNHRVSL